ncbi:PAS domain S-box protein [Halostella salina]|uniref:PAS domain S-box protein n=1 Tax=Halostella salina TaxID=1547897 RepID=UPI000EF848EC|nr:PAS domain S-box protein [Halostella salina]
MSKEMKILYAGRDTDLATETARSIRREDGGIAVETVTGTEDGLARFDESDHDCVVAAYDLPRSNGIEFLESVRDRSPDLPFILFPADGSEAIASRAMSADATDYVRRHPDSEGIAELVDRIVDCVDRHRARRSTERTHRLLTELAEHTVDCLWVTDGDWEELLFISGYESVWGRSEAAIREDPRDFLNAVDPEYRESVEGAMERLSDGEVIDIEFPIRKGDGETGWVWAKGEPVFDDGEVVRVVGFTREITDRKAREQDLERYETLIQETTDIVTVLDQDGTVRYQNPAVERVLGYDQDELAGENAFDYVHPEDRPTVVDRFSDLVSERNETYRVQFRMQHADGSWRWLESGATNRTETALDGYVVASRDITERVENERELERYREYTGRIFDAIDDLFFVHDEDGNMQRWNEQFAAVTGYDDEAIVSMKGSDFVPESDRGRAASRIEQVFEEGHARLEAPILTSDGDTIPHEFVANRVEHPDGELRLAGIGRDVTERKRHERELERQNERLEEFASFVSHDLRSPLQVLSGSIKAAEETGDDSHFERCYQTLDRMERMIDDLLTLAHEGTLAVDREPVQLSDLSEQCWQNVRTTGAELTVESTQTILADRDRFTQLMENLFRNALDHCDDDVRVAVGDIPDGFYVEDDGPGVPEGERDRVFDIGYTTDPDGTGIGLRIAEEIVAAHGWEIDVRAGGDGGARFEITGVEEPDG